MLKNRARPAFREWGQKIPSTWGPFARIAREVTELELLLHAFDRVPLAPLF